MELDFKTVKALSSPTRIEILNEALRKESTPTEISKNIDRSKSTVSSHLEKLRDADLLEKESKEGRRRVVYHPTEKTEAILNGRSKKVKFSLLSTVSNAWIGIGFGLAALQSTSSAQSSSSTGGMGAMAMDKGAEAGQRATEAGSLTNPENILLITGLGFLSIAVFGLLYGFLVSRLNK
jgi:DNA-binding transcriptional ArsR family regulator